MIYIIDDQITYNSDDCTLNHIPTQEALSLSISAGRLFEQLLNSQGEILARETLLTEVWDKYGLRGSNSNLNQYLSILRRALAAYDCENLIITIPKVGIRLNTEIKIEREPPPAFVMAGIHTDEMPAESEAGGQNSVALSPDPVIADKIVKKPYLTFRQVIFVFIILILLGYAFWYYVASESAEKDTSMTTVKLEGGCEAVIIQNNQSCVPGRRIYFDKSTLLTPAGYGRTILSACNLNSSGRIVSCDNIYYLDWRTI